MKTKALIEVLSSHEHCTQNDDTVEIAAEVEVSLYASLGSETLMIAGLSAIKISEELLIASTRKGEIYAILPDDLRAVRMGKSNGNRRTGLI